MADEKEDVTTVQDVDAAYEAAMAVNLDEVVAEPITVTIREFRVVTDENGNKVRKKVDRTASIETFVPMRIFNRMLASREKVMQQRKKFQDGKIDLDEDPMITWIMSQVLEVWKLTEPDMTREKLEEGLRFMQIQKLFTIFFGDVLRQSPSKADNG